MAASIIGVAVASYFTKNRFFTIRSATLTAIVSVRGSQGNVGSRPSAISKKSIGFKPSSLFLLIVVIDFNGFTLIFHLSSR